MKRIVVSVLLLCLLGFAGTAGAEAGLDNEATQSDAEVQDSSRFLENTAESETSEDIELSDADLAEIDSWGAELDAAFVETATSTQEADANTDAAQSESDAELDALSAEAATLESESNEVENEIAQIDSALEENVPDNMRLAQTENANQGIGEFFSKVASAGAKVKDAVKSAVKKVAEKVKNVVKAAVHIAKKAAKKIGDSKFGQAAKHLAHKVKEVAKKLWHKGKHLVKKALKKLGHLAKKGWKGAKHLYHKGKHWLKKHGHRLGRRIRRFGRRLRRWLKRLRRKLRKSHRWMRCKDLRWKRRNISIHIHIGGPCHKHGGPHPIQPPLCPEEEEEMDRVHEHKHHGEGGIIFIPIFLGGNGYGHPAGPDLATPDPWPGRPDTGGLDHIDHGVYLHQPEIDDNGNPLPTNPLTGEPIWDGVHPKFKGKADLPSVTRLPEDVEDCVACQYVWKQIEQDVGNSAITETIYDSFNANAMDAQRTPLFYPAVQTMFDAVDDMISDYMDGYTVNQICENSMLCRPRNLDQFLHYQRKTKLI